MKVKRVVVDELPNNCGDCRFGGIDYKYGYYCNLMKKSVDINESYKRPNWCPLVVGDKLLFEHSIMKRWVENKDLTTN